ncbi:770_t:CDS:2, partial [Paraglomus brasilianum]
SFLLALFLSSHYETPSMLTIKAMRGRLNPFRNVEGAAGVFGIAASFISTLLVQTQPNSVFMASTSMLKSKPFQKQGMQGQAEDNEDVNVGNTEEEKA